MLCAKKKAALCVKQSRTLEDLEPYIMSYPVCFAAPFLKKDFLLKNIFWHEIQHSGSHFCHVFGPSGTQIQLQENTR